MTMSPLDLTRVPDCCGGGSDELASLGWDRALDRARVVTLEADGGFTVNDKSFAVGGRPIALRSLVTTAGSSLATAYRNNAPRAALRVHVTATGANVVVDGEKGGSVPLGLDVSPSAYGTPADDVSIYRLDPGSGLRFVTVRDGDGGVEAEVPIP